MLRREAPPQVHCSRIHDHTAHDFLRLNPWGYVRCPGRHTPDQLADNRPITRPADPFAGIPGAGGSVWD